jgi:isopentenyl-diphosphate delta-isomerase
MKIQLTGAEEKVILVDKNDCEVGIEDKIIAHKEGKLHRAFSIFIFNIKGELLLQQRAITKYHSGGLWTNTCCGHPKPEEPLEKAAHRRLREEMGISCKLQRIDSFIYQVNFVNGLFEYEYDHVLVGKFNGSPILNPVEVITWKWIQLNQLKFDIDKNPDNYTYWLKIIINQLNFA